MDPRELLRLLANGETNGHGRLSEHHGLPWVATDVARKAAGAHLPLPLRFAANELGLRQYVIVRRVPT